MKVLMIAAALAIAFATSAAHAGKCTDPCLDTFIDLRDGTVFLASRGSHPPHARLYVWQGWDAYRAMLKRKYQKP